MKSFIKKCIITILIFINTFVFAQDKYDFAIYFDLGAWEEGTIAFEQFLDWKGLTHQRINAVYVNEYNLTTNYKGIYFPGGNAGYYNYLINANGAQHIQQLVANNGYYIGMCAGADFACDKITWEGITYDYPLNLFEGITVGPIDNIAPWPNYTMTTITMNSDDEINQFGNSTEEMLYWGGATFSIATNSFDIVATYADVNQPAIIKFNYNNGRVLLIGSHPEIEEDSNRDHTNIVEELDDNGSDWNFLWTATDWLLKRPISIPINTLNFQLYPNPAVDIVYIKSNNKIESINVYNLQGQIVFIQKTNQKYIDVSNLTNGVYIIKIQTYNHITTKKLIIQK
jgi:glutamine amidotransferase-like uncharacterized protein